MTKFVTGSFNDFKGEKHQFVIAASVINPNRDRLFDICEGVYDGPDDETGDWTAIPAEKILGIGISICSPRDKFNLEIGKAQAEGRSKKRCDRFIAFTKGGMCTESIIDTFLQENKANLIENPGKFIKGYNAAEKKYLESLKNEPKK